MPPSTLPQNKKPHVENFYQNSFKQLSNVQQKQVGLLVGAAVADAAARGMAGLSAADIAAFEREALDADRDHEEAMHALASERRAKALARRQRSTPATPTPSPPPDPRPHAVSAAAAADVHSPLVFANAAAAAASGKHSGPLPASSPSPSPPHGTAQLLAFHSFSYHLFYDLLRTMSAARGDFPVHYVARKWVETAQSVAAADASVYTGEVGSLLHALCTLLPVPTMYPYASDADMRDYVGPFVRMLTDVPLPEGGAAASPDATLELVSSGGGGAMLTTTVAEARAAEQSLATDMTLSALGVVIRFLQSNPDPDRNGAFMAVPGTGDMFTTDSAAFVPKPTRQNMALTPEALARRRAVNAALLAHYEATREAGRETVALVPRRPVLQDARTIREGLSVVANTRGFAHGVVQAVRLGGPVCQRAMLVGALLGAKLGARQVPLPWLSATVDHQPVATMAIEVAQWAWNPPHH